SSSEGSVSRRGHRAGVATLLTSTRLRYGRDIDRRLSCGGANNPLLGTPRPPCATGRPRGNWGTPDLLEFSPESSKQWFDACCQRQDSSACSAGDWQRQRAA